MRSARHRPDCAVCRCFVEGLVDNLALNAIMCIRVHQEHLRWFANNKGADQPAHTRSLISAFVIRLL